MAYPVCNKVPEEKCVNVPRKACDTLIKQQCTNLPYQSCIEVPRQNCDSGHKKVPNRISKRVPITVCDDGSGTGYSGRVHRAGWRIRGYCCQKRRGQDYIR